MHSLSCIVWYLQFILFIDSDRSSYSIRRVVNRYSFWLCLRGVFRRCWSLIGSLNWRCNRWRAGKLDRSCWVRALVPRSALWLLIRDDLLLDDRSLFGLCSRWMCRLSSSSERPWRLCRFLRDPCSGSRTLSRSIAHTSTTFALNVPTWLGKNFLSIFLSHFCLDLFVWDDPFCWICLLVCRRGVCTLGGNADWGRQYCYERVRSTPEAVF